MSLDEIARAYDTLLFLLSNKEDLIKMRLKKTLEHHGKEERILFESQDYMRELEDIPEVYSEFHRKKYG